jgi:putative mRNA 3-end processing factor
MTELTFEVSEILLYDMMKISQFFLPFDNKAIVKMRRHIQFLNYKERRKIGVDSYITLLNSGHIPGSSMILLEIDGKTILYTSDFNSVQTQLMDPAIPPLNKIDALITESTYGTSDHDPRIEVEKSFIESVNRILDSGDSQVLVPAFGVSRSQEILMVLNKHNIKYPIFCDGMARKIARIYDTYPKFFRSWREMSGAFDNTHFISQRNRFQEREKAKNTKGIVVAPSGMLKGGTARMYTENIIKNPNSAIYFVSYQMPESPGSVLLNERKYVLNSRNINSGTEDVPNEVKRFEFSSHSGKTDLIEFAEHCQFTSKNKKVFIVHGEEEVSIAFSEELKKKGFDSQVPKQGEEFIL